MILILKSMAKRSNPYSEDFIQQSKIHVGLKQFNNNEERLKKVYEKTLQLLYQGAKKTLQGDVLQCSDISLIEKKNKMKQLFIGKNGALQHSGTLRAVDACGGGPRCACGARRAGRCEYCEAALCAACRTPCAVCRLPHCERCSISGSEGSEICVSCYS